MPIKKSELYSSLWKSCDELRGGMDASQYKDYVLVLLFMKYVSDKAASQKGYLLDVPKGASFTDMVALKGNKDIGEKINTIIEKLAEANDLTGAIDIADFNDPEKLGKGQDMVDRLSNLVAIFDTPALDFRSNPFEEQQAIAAVLSDMDAEIAALEQRLAKTRALKQGMMQALLTGRVRLAQTASAQLA